jgi:hypothetical protein
VSFHSAAECFNSRNSHRCTTPKSSAQARFGLKHALPSA